MKENSINGIPTLTTLSNFMQEQNFEEAAYSANKSDSSVKTKKSTNLTKVSKSNGTGSHGKSQSQKPEAEGQQQEQCWEQMAGNPVPVQTLQEIQVPQSTPRLSCQLAFLQ